jgi:hypothetical protein
MNAWTGFGIIVAIQGATMPYNTAGWILTMIFAGLMGAMGLWQERRDREGERE